MGTLHALYTTNDGTSYLSITFDMFARTKRCVLKVLFLLAARLSDRFELKFRWQHSSDVVSNWKYLWVSFTSSTTYIYIDCVFTIKHIQIDTIVRSVRLIGIQSNDGLSVNSECLVNRLVITNFHTVSLGTRGSWCSYSASKYTTYQYGGVWFKYIQQCICQNKK